MTAIRRITAATVAIGTLAALAGAPAAFAADSAAKDDPYTITIHAGDNDNTLKGRTLTAYKLADYIDGTYVSMGSKELDGVAVDTPETLETALDKVLAKTTGVSDVSKLPGWNDSGKDPIAWMGGFRQNTGSNQSAGTFGFGWNESGAQKTGTNSPTKAYVGTVREFADNLVKDSDALNAVEKQPHSDSKTFTAGKTGTLTVPSTGIYLIVDTGGDTTWSGTLNGKDATYNVGSSQPMIVPTKADDKDVATVDGYTKPMDKDKLGKLGALGDITIKNVDDQEVLPGGGETPKKRDESVAAGKDAADNASDVGDTVPYVVTYRVPDLSAYRNALDNGRPWTYTYRVNDKTTKGLRITDTAPTVTVTANGKTQTIQLTKVDQLPAMPGDQSATANGQKEESSDAWYYLEQQDGDASHLVVGLGKWLVRNYGDLAANVKDGTTLYGATVQIKYSAQVTEKALDNGNKVNNDNNLTYSNKPEDVTAGRTTTTPDVVVKQWTYDVDLHKRASTSYTGLEGAEFKVTVKDKANTSDSKTDGQDMKFVKTADGTYRQAKPGETGTTTVVTGKDGLLRLRGLDLGVYTLTETKAPHNYQPLKSSEDVTISAKFTDDKTNYVTPDAQTEATETITQNNTISPLSRPMLTFRATSNLPEGLTVTKTNSTQVAQWSGKDKSGAYYADDKTNWVSADLTLLDQPINVMLAKTGRGPILLGAAVAGGITLMALGANMARRRRV